MTAPDLEAIRRRQYAARDAHARVMRAAEPNSDRADDYPNARWAEIDAAMESAADVPALLEHIDRLSDVIRDLLRLSAVPADPPDEAIVRERAEALLAKVPPRPVPATDNDVTEVE